jgi:hypothetical protein
MLMDGSTFRLAYNPPDPPSAMAHAVHSLDRAIGQKDIPMARKALDELLEQDFQGWKTAKNPLQIWHVLSLAMIHSPSTANRRWFAVYQPVYVQNQIRNGAQGWWSEKSLGIESREMAGLQGKSRDIWVTCMMLISFPPTKLWPCPFCSQDMWGESKSDEAVEFTL